MKNSIVLIEFIFSVIIFAVISIFSMKIILSFYEKNYRSTLISTSILKLETTRLFLIKNKNLSNLEYTDDKLYYDTDLLLSEVQNYTISVKDSIYTINICIGKKSSDTICQEWKI